MPCIDHKVSGYIALHENGELEKAQEYYDYVRLSEGPVFGIKVPIKDYIAITGLYNPSKHRVAGNDLSISKNGQFMLNLTFYKIFGGTK